jgi:phage terminase small subunit
MMIKNKSGYIQQVPHISISLNYLKMMHKLAVEFGMTPSARSRIIADKGYNDTDDPMELILYEGGRKK